VGFYKGGKVLKEYLVGDLIDDPKNLPQSVSHFQWRELSTARKSVSYDEKQGKLTIVTVEGKTLVFDIYSGDLQKETAEPEDIKPPAANE
jgi:hypothetical protein